ncbi:kelch-like protein 28 isoform X3 [Arctopsyche grandis]|uniref:kelch-like protein 28 isoform X3 n=1 Tax=Arctopsyche grandis TaxID=121162 RepID=UPI00406DA060
MTDNDHQKQMQYGFSHMQSMQNFYTQGMFSDIDLIILEKRYHTHKSILYSASPYFRAKLDQNMDIRDLEICVDGIRKESVEKVFEFLYKGTLEMTIEQVANILKLAEILELDELKKNCYSFLETVCRDNNQVSQKTEDIDKYLLYNFSKITSHEKYLNLSVENVKQLLLSDDLQESSETKVFKGLYKWIKYDWNNRKKDLYSLMKYIRLPLCDVPFLLEEVRSLCCESDSESPFSIVLDALRWHQMAEKRSSLRLMNAKCRNMHKQVLILGGYYSEISGIIDMYNPITNSWSELFHTTLKIINFSAVIFKKNVFIFGGTDANGNITNEVHSFNIHTRTLNKLAAMNCKRSESTAAVVGDRIFVIGGFGASNFVEEYDYVKNSWKKVAPMNDSRYNHTSVVYKEDIYVFGGYNGSSRLNSVKTFSPKTNKWKTLRPMKRAISLLSAVVVDDYIYCIGGYDGSSHLSNVERYDPRSDTWTSMRDSLVKNYCFQAVCYKGKIICFGGYDSEAVQEYDPVNDQFKIIGEMSNKRCNYNALII